MMDCLYCCHLAEICPSDLVISLSSPQILLGALLPMLNAAEHLFHLLVPPVLWPLRSPCTTIIVVSRFFLVLDPEADLPAQAFTSAILIAHFSAGTIRHSIPGFMLISLVDFRPRCRPTPWLKTRVPPAFADASSIGSKHIEIIMFISLGVWPGFNLFSVLRL